MAAILLLAAAPAVRDGISDSGLVTLEGAAGVFEPRVLVVEGIAAVAGVLSSARVAAVSVALAGGDCGSLLVVCAATAAFSFSLPVVFSEAAVFFAASAAAASDLAAASAAAFVSFVGWSLVFAVLAAVSFPLLAEPLTAVSFAEAVAGSLLGALAAVFASLVPEAFSPAVALAVRASGEAGAAGVAGPEPTAEAVVFSLPGDFLSLVVVVAAEASPALAVFGAAASFAAAVLELAAASLLDPGLAGAAGFAAPSFAAAVAPAVSLFTGAFIPAVFATVSFSFDDSLAVAVSFAPVDLLFAVSLAVAAGFAAEDSAAVLAGAGGTLATAFPETAGVDGFFAMVFVSTGAGVSIGRNCCERVSEKRFCKIAAPAALALALALAFDDGAEGDADFAGVAEPANPLDFSHCKRLAASSWGEEASCATA